MKSTPKVLMTQTRPFSRTQQRETYQVMETSLATHGARSSLASLIPTILEPWISDLNSEARLAVAYLQTLDA